jgi:hypothetical protein
VESIQWVDRDGLRSIIARSKAGELKMSPWCALMCEEFVFKWWDAMEAGTLKDCYDWSQVHTPPLPLPTLLSLLLLHFVFTFYSLLSFFMLRRCIGSAKASEKRHFPALSHQQRN